MNFNIANLGSLPADYASNLEGNLDFAALGAADDDRFAHILRDERRREEQAEFDARDRNVKQRQDDGSQQAERPEKERPAEDRDRTGEIDARDKRKEQRVASSDEQRKDGDRRGDATETDRADRPSDTVRHARDDGDPAGNGETPQHGDAKAQPAAQEGPASQDQAQQSVINQPQAADALIQAAEQRPNAAVSGLQAAVPGSPDPLSNGTLPNPMQVKPTANTGSTLGAADEDGIALKVGPQIQTSVDKQLTTRQKGVLSQRGGDPMTDVLPRPQLNRNMPNNALGQPLNEAGQRPAGATANAANMANLAANNNAGNTVQTQQITVSPERAAHIEMPILAARTDGAASPVPPAPQPQTALPLDGEAGGKLLPIGEDSGKSSGNSSHLSTANSTAASGSKGAAVTQQNAGADIRGPVVQVAIQLSKAVQNGIDRLSIRLDPAELGKVHVKLEVGHDGRAIALVSAERPETLDMLQKDARSLERALQEAGLETDAGSLSFSLSQGDQQGGALADDGDDKRALGHADEDETDGDRTPAADELPRVVSNRALDISV